MDTPLFVCWWWQDVYGGGVVLRIHANEVMKNEAVKAVLEKDRR